MSETIAAAEELLREADYDVGSISTLEGHFMTFESDSILGFVACYRDAASLLENWRMASAKILESAKLALRRSETKAWNTYFVFLAEAPGDYGQNIALGAIEEDLVGTRKIARAGVATIQELRSALLPLLPVQTAPRLEPVDMATEIKLRTSELSSDLVETFLSNASEATILQFLEDSQ